MLVAVPPWMQPKFRVVSSATRPLFTAAMARAAAAMALTPASGEKPAWEARPRISAVNSRMVGAAVTASPSGPS